MKPPIDVTASGAVLLGPDVACDGFHCERVARVQTHVHADHMYDFESSKGLQEILMSEATRRLLCAEQDADLPYRSNLRALNPGEPYAIRDSKVELWPSGHMLGSVQVVVQLDGGTRVGYSGDFQWPLDVVPELDGLVVDSTYGSPESVREFSQGECEERFLELVARRVNEAPIHIVAHRGTLQRALQLVSEAVDCPLIGTERLRKEIRVYQDFGYGIGEVLSVDSEKGHAALAEGRYVRLYGTGDQRPVDIGNATMIKLSAYFTRPDQPVTEYSARSFGVALSNHADFNGTLEYVEATGASFVVTDNTRGGRGVELALEIRRRLGIQAKPCTQRYTPEWGH